MIIQEHVQYPLGLYSTVRTFPDNSTTPLVLIYAARRESALKSWVREKDLWLQRVRAIFLSSALLLSSSSSSLVCTLRQVRDSLLLFIEGNPEHVARATKLRSFLELSVSLVLVDLMAAVTFWHSRSLNYRSLDVSSSIQAADTKKRDTGIQSAWISFASSIVSDAATCWRHPRYPLTASNWPRHSPRAAQLTARPASDRQCHISL